MTEEEAQATTSADKPTLVFIYDGSDEDQRFVIEDHKAFAEHKVAVGARFFDCVRIDAESAKGDRVFKDQHFTKLPALVFVRPNFEIGKAIVGRFTANRVFSAMSSVLKKDYRMQLKAVLKEQKEILKGWAKLDKRYVELRQLNDAIAEEQSQKKRGEMMRKRDALQTSLSASEATLEKREGDLYELESNEAKP